ncbi:helix-turn-helix domain-containing protein [Erysipelothrix urinaevulpis]|uniref:helix-turn-helix domain-containing protein n=1 Tax=Erysipelothrix urinaevulpis TaxID=2683717 RepID=UPI0013570652|nr:helix-turn-helix domain-containing protein [Erysipelothrix urinaevulpis]
MTRKVSYKLKPWLTESGLLRIQGWARDGLTNEDIAKNIGINPKTLYDWIKKWPEIEEALRLGKEPADRKVENALYENALGFEWQEEVPIKLKREFYVGNKKHTEEYVETVTVNKKRPPDTTAAIFWLKNRKPSDWRDKQDVEVSGGMDGTIKINIVPDKDD